MLHRGPKNGQNLPKGKRPNADEKKERRAAALSLFLRQYGRTAKRGGLDPNDRKYSRKLALKVKKHLKPRVMDALLRDDES